MRAAFFSMLLSAGLALVSSNQASAAAASGAALNEANQQSGSLLLVRDGCGRGRHFSRYRGICIWDGAPYRAYGYPAPAYGYGYAPYGPPVYGPPVYGSGFYGPPVYGYYRRW